MLKPREKLELYGVKNLENHELLSLIFSHGTKKESVFEISKKIIGESGFYSAKYPKSLSACQSQFDINKVHAGQFLATVELGRRLFSKKEVHIRNAKEAFEYLCDMKKLKKEVFRGIYLSTSLEILADEVISIGSLDKNIIHPREVFEPAFSNHAYGLIIAHNHPSGEAQPSDEDIKITQELVKTAKMMQITLIDHIIIANKGSFSFKDAGILHK